MHRADPWDLIIRNETFYILRWRRDAADATQMVVLPFGYVWYECGQDTHTQKKPSLEIWLYLEDYRIIAYENVLWLKRTYTHAQKHNSSVCARDNEVRHQSTYRSDWWCFVLMCVRVVKSARAKTLSMRKAYYCYCYYYYIAMYRIGRPYSLNFHHVEKENIHMLGL